MNDNLNENIFADDREIDLKDMLFYICKRWRSLLIGTLIIMIAMILIRVPAMTELSGAAAVFKQLVKYALIGIVAGIILMCIVYAVSYVISGKIKSESDFRSNCRMNVLGVLPRVDNSKMNRIDRWIRQLFGVELKSRNLDKLSDRMAEELKAILSTKGKEKEDTNNVPCVAVVSTESDSSAKQLTVLLEPKLKGSIRIISAGDILTKAESIQTVMKASWIVMVEKIGVSEYRKLEDGVKKLALWNKNVLGMVLIDGNAR